MAETNLEQYSTKAFVALDNWLNRSVAENGEEASEIVSHAFQNNINANLSFYEGLANEADRNGYLGLSARVKAVAKLYKALSLEMR